MFAESEPWAESIAVARDVARSFELESQACDGGIVHACTMLARKLRYGVGAARDLPRAIELLRKGCDGGDPWACKLLKTGPSASR